jgi:hypothetical protein
VAYSQVNPANSKEEIRVVKMVLSDKSAGIKCVHALALWLHHWPCFKCRRRSNATDHALPPRRSTPFSVDLVEGVEYHVLKLPRETKDAATLAVRRAAGHGVTS